MTDNACGASVDAIKIQSFGRQNPDTPFPKFSSLMPAECVRLQTALATRLGIHPHSEPFAVLNEVQRRATHLPGINAENALDLYKVIALFGINAGTEVFINWHRFDRIDRIALLDLSNHFSDIWYPGSDDIEIFDESFDWLVAVHHDGDVRVIPSLTSAI